MAEIINLNRARKARAKAAAQASAAANRFRFGRDKASKLAETLAAARAKQVLDDAKREP